MPGARAGHRLSLTVTPKCTPTISFQTSYNLRRSLLRSLFAPQVEHFPPWQVKRFRLGKGDPGVAPAGSAAHDEEGAYDASEDVHKLLSPPVDGSGRNFAERLLEEVASPRSGRPPCTAANGGQCIDGCVLRRGWTSKMRRDALSYTLTYFSTVRVTQGNGMTSGLGASGSGAGASGIMMDSDSDLDENIKDRWVKVLVETATGMCELTRGTYGKRPAPFTDEWMALLTVPVTRVPATWTRGQLVGLSSTMPHSERVSVEVNDACILFGVGGAV